MRQQWRITGNHWAGLFVMVLVLIAVFFILQGVFKILSWIAPVLLILAVIINYRTVVNYGVTIVRLLRTRTLLGILAIILTVIGFPVVAAYLFGRALLDRKVRRLTQEYEQRREDQYVDYEDLTERSDRLELPNLERRKTDSSDYEDFLKP